MAFPAADVVALIWLGEHRASSDVYRELEELLSVELPKGGYGQRRHPPCCDGDEAPILDRGVVDALYELTARGRPPARRRE